MTKADILQDLRIIGATEISNKQFMNNNEITIITIPDSVTTIGSHAFFGCSSLTSIIIPDSVTTIGEGAFRGCSSLTSITVPDSVTTIGKSDFYDCRSLTSIIIPHGVTRIGELKFAYCTTITSFIIPDSVTKIGKHAFCGCSSLKSIIIPDSVITIGRYAFYDCSNLKMVIASCFTSEQQANPLTTTTFHNCHPSLKIVTPEEINAATIIQIAFRQARYNPRHKMCRILKINEFWSLSGVEFEGLDGRSWLSYVDHQQVEEARQHMEVWRQNK